jgi:hypothetical protein
MTDLEKLFREKAKQFKDIYISKINETSYSVYSVSFPADYLNIDFINGRIEPSETNKGIKEDIT